MNQILPVAQQAHVPSAFAQSGMDSFVHLIERALTNPELDPSRLQHFLELREKEMTRAAKQAFNTAMAEAQKEMGPITADKKNTQTRSQYASYEALDTVVRPVYTKHGFALTFIPSGSPSPDCVRVTGLLTHRDGYEREYPIDMPCDGRGARGGEVMTKTHAMGSAITYGKRYILMGAFNLAIDFDEDDDGNAAGNRHQTARREEPRYDAISTTPHKLSTDGHNYDSWVKAFVFVINRVTSDYAEVETWGRLNADLIREIKTQKPEAWEPAQKAIEGVKQRLAKEPKEELPPETHEATGQQSAGGEPREEIPPGEQEAQTTTTQDHKQWLNDVGKACAAIARDPTKNWHDMAEYQTANILPQRDHRPIEVYTEAMTTVNKYVQKMITEQKNQHEATKQ